MIYFVKCISEHSDEEKQACQRTIKYALCKRQVNISVLNMLYIHREHLKSFILQHPVAKTALIMKMSRGNVFYHLRSTLPILFLFLIDFSINTT